MDLKGQNNVTVYIPMRQTQDYVIRKPEFLELVIRIVLQMPFPLLPLIKNWKTILHLQMFSSVYANYK